MGALFFWRGLSCPPVFHAPIKSVRGDSSPLNRYLLCYPTTNPLPVTIPTSVPASITELHLTSFTSNMMQMQSTDITETKTQITARLPNTVVNALDAAARHLRRSRAEIVRRAVERYLEDFDDLSVTVDRLRDPSDPVLDWDQVRRDLLDTD